jgi:hypothetical protein
MTDTNAASEAARQLVRQRWGTRGLDRAVDVVVTRSAELSPVQLAELAAVLEEAGADE